MEIAFVVVVVVPLLLYNHVTHSQSLGQSKLVWPAGEDRFSTCLVPEGERRGQLK